MTLYFIDGTEERKPEEFGEDLIYQAISSNVEVAKTRVWNDGRDTYRYGFYSRVTLVRVQNKGEVIEMAFENFAGITEDEETVSVHMYQLGSYDDAGQTVRLNKKDNSVIAEEYYTIPCFKYPPDEDSRKMMYEDWELQYGSREEWRI